MNNTLVFLTISTSDVDLNEIQIDAEIFIGLIAISTSSASLLFSNPKHSTSATRNARGYSIVKRRKDEKVQTIMSS